MATLDVAERARDQIAERHLDGIRVLSVGIVNTEDGYGVGIVATTELTVEPLDGDLADVEIHITVSGGGPIELH